MVLFEGFSGRFKHIRLRGRSAACSVCGDAPTQTDLGRYGEPGNLCATDQVSRLGFGVTPLWVLADAFAARAKAGARR